MKTFPPPSPEFFVHVKVPATCANLGPGFDVLGVALDHYNDVELSAWDSSLMPPVTVQVDGEGAAVLPLDKSNLVHRVARRVIDLAGVRATALRVKLSNRIPLARGLGSSSAAIIGGLLAANTGCGKTFSHDDLLKLAVEEEGHPDNVVPALLGGLCASATGEGGKVRFLSWKDKRLFSGLRAVVCVPYYELPTQEARRVLPDQVSRGDAVFNSSRVALFLGALQQKRYDLLADAMDDRLHQPYRKKLVPGLDDVIQAARQAGAYGAALSGAGPSVVALTAPKAAQSVGEAMSEAFRRRQIASLWLNLSVDVNGARVVKVNRKLGKKGRS